MATSDVQPKADQPRVTTKDLTKPQASIQYRVQGIKPIARQPQRTQSRNSARGY